MIRAVALLALVAALAGCGGDDDGGSGPKACELLPDPTVERATGARVIYSSPGERTETRSFYTTRPGDSGEQTVRLTDTAKCTYLLDSDNLPGQSDLRLVSTLVGRIDPAGVPGIFRTADDAAALDAGLSDLGDVRKKRIGELGDRAVLYTWTKGQSFRIVAAEDGDVASLDGQNVEPKAGEKIVREMLVALRRSRPEAP